ncbi:Major facilitator superfamily domain general substrate transporter [Penicillium fimorum]|uniref:Major facilitator superfamily domain general substrate transporter n=1 Tax=Penicillium fimorum TaxID=1882269 RepID=A0A9W9XRB1_9EURO|nr:Major facilitator superfamily domain general substrate transporter [Penicillium fimorum]
MVEKEKMDATLSDKVVPQRPFGTAAERARRSLNAKLSNPLAGFSHTELRKQGRTFAELHEMGEDSDIRAFELGAVLAQSPERSDNVAGLTNQEKRGMDQTVVNGAQIFYKYQFGIGKESSRNAWILGLINSAPYLCCAFISSWLTVPFNHWFGRCGTIFLTCCFSAIACLWQGFVPTWWAMFVARFMLGFGIGPKSATVPIYAAETPPPSIRGALVMQWHVWTAFGIMIGYAEDLIFYNVDSTVIIGLNWRCMMASAMFPALVVCYFVFACPESPHWYMRQKQYYRAYKSICTLRHHKIQAARDLYYMHTLLEAEDSMKAMLASQIVMFMQQFCGVNVISYYSSEIFLEAKFSPPAALAASLGLGLINWLLSIPAVYTIDTFGRRNLLLLTFPLMAMTMLFTGFSFWIPESSHTARLACIALGTYLFGVVYSRGEGPVLFTYTAEVYPLYVRSYGMALGTATMWFCNFLLGVTWPSLRAAFTIQGAFAWHAGWCLVGWWLVLLFMPETKGKTLELDQVFSVLTRLHARDVMPEVLYEREELVKAQDVGFNA